MIIDGKMVTIRCNRFGEKFRRIVGTGPVAVGCGIAPDVGAELGASLVSF